MKNLETIQFRELNQHELLETSGGDLFPSPGSIIIGDLSKLIMDVTSGKLATGIDDLIQLYKDLKLAFTI